MAGLEQPPHVSETYSVVIPAYNAEKTIVDCLRSVADQTLSPIEVIVVDDHGSDGTESKARGCATLLAQSGVALEYLRMERNAGPSAARNLGLKAARGTFVAFLDADDTWNERKLEIVDRHVAALGSPLLLCHEYTDDTEFGSSRGGEPHVAKALSVYRMLLRNPAQTSSAVLRNEGAPFFDEGMRHCEDYDLWMRIAETAPVIKLIGPPLTRLGRPQLSAGGLSGDTLRMRIGELRVYRNFCLRALPRRFWLFPGLIVFSFSKHVYSFLRRRLRIRS